MTVSLYHNSPVWLDTQDASSWDRNPPNFTLDLVSYCSADICQLGNFNAFRAGVLIVYIYIYIYIYIYKRTHTYKHTYTHMKAIQ